MPALPENFLTIKNLVLASDKVKDVWVGMIEERVCVEVAVVRSMSIKTLIFLSLAVVFLLTASVWQAGVLAQDRQKALTQYGHDVWQAEQGLPQNSVQAIAQTRDGYLWLGTQEGLVRFDGVRFTVFDKRNTEAIKHKNINSLIGSQDGSLWIGTGGGLTRLKDGKFTTFTTQEGLLGNAITCLYEDRQGRLWIGTNNGLSQFKDERFIHYTTKDGLANNGVLAIYEDHAGRLWVGTNGGLDCLQEGRFTHYSTQEGLPSNGVGAIFESKDQSLWIGTSGGLARLKDGQLTAYTKKDGLSHDAIRAFYEDQTGSLWIGTFGGGMNRLASGQFTSFTTHEGLSNDFVMSLYADREGSLWIGTYGGGLNRLRDNRFVTYGTKEGLANEMARAVYESRDGSVWIGTQGGGASRLKDGRLINYTTKDGLPHDVVMSFHEDRAGNMWIGSNGGLSRFKDGRFTNFAEKDGLSPGSVRAIYEDREGGLWVGLNTGKLYRFKDGKFTSYADQGFVSAAVWTIHEDRAGQLWIGSSRGLTRFKDGQFTTYTTQDGLSHNSVFAFSEDRDDTYWIGTYTGGLNRLKGGKFTSYTAKDGLLDDLIYQVLDDGRGNLWLTCNKGISRVSKQELNDFAEGKIKTITSTLYGTADGMRSSECNGASQPSAWKSKDGRLWFSTLRGVAVIDPNNLKHNPLLPPVIIERILVDKQAIALPALAQLPPGKGELEFQYTGLSFLAPGRVKFKYKLEGFDQDWVDAGTRRTAYYTNLPPGQYRFRVMACNSDGVWNEEGAAFAFYLRPHFYQTYWFYALCVLGAALIGVGIYLLRIRQVKVHERELVLLVSERTQKLEQEIAERERMEETLRESEAVFRSLTETVPAAIYIYRGSQYLYLNPAAEVISGYTRDELMQMEVWEIVHPDFREQIKARAALRQQGEDAPQHSEIKILTKRGEERWVDLTASRIQFQGQQALLATAFDITERKQAEEALRQSEERYRTIIEEMTDSFWELDLAGHFTFFNHQVMIEQGRSREELFALNRNRYRPHIDEENYKIAAESFAQIYRTGEPIRGITYEMIRGDGTRYTIETNLSLIRDAAGQPIGFRGISRDVTERLRAEKELQQAKEAAEAANRAKSEFLANMSHEIRTPMNGIIGMTELALETPLTTEQHEYLGMVKASAGALLTIINDILDFSKIEAGKLTLDAADFKLRQNLDDTLKPLRLRAEQKGLQFDCYISPEAPDELVGDAGRLRQILINLIGNAIKFTDQGQITVRVEPEASTDEKVQLRFAVSDTGVGIPPEKQRLIFEAFLQADGSTTRQYGGTGLGLTISSRLVEIMGGQIGVESTVGEGSTFSFTVQFSRSSMMTADSAPPRQMPSPLDHPPLHARQALPERQRGLQILLAEDNLVNQRLAVRLLEKQGYQVTVAGTGRETLAALDRQPFDLVLMDVQMPEMDGLEATISIRRQERATGAHLPIIAMTAHAMKGDRERCLDAGMDGYVSKPIQPTELFKVITELVPTEAIAASQSLAREPQQTVFNRAVALKQVADDEELLAELAGLFIGDSARLLAEVKQAIAGEKSEGLERAAHTLKGAAGNFGAEGVVAAAQKLEEMGRTGKLAEAEAACVGLEAEMNCLNQALGTLLEPSLG